MNQWLDFKVLTWLGSELKQWRSFVYKPRESVHWGLMRLRDHFDHCYVKTTLYCINIKCRHQCVGQIFLLRSVKERLVSPIDHKRVYWRPQEGLLCLWKSVTAKILINERKILILFLCPSRIQHHAGNTIQTNKKV